jgi:hypothetical protein
VSLKRTLGTCYYPEHWPEETWAEDAARMAGLGLTWVRIGEFAWSRLEAEPGRFDWGWMDRAFDVLTAAGLKIVLGTPTATPPRWMIDRHPDMLAVDATGARGASDPAGTTVSRMTATGRRPSASPRRWPTATAITRASARGRRTTNTPATTRC